ncbi:MAG TPA: hypothetical protein VFJ94_10695 [Intrasporangium sp.]|uniref:hypothetical protein n=1 Tax=Intrasporangium sp. TaxID=1925024 RepID=UPI002D79647A|nr:hypothetical protein [Intrasporangium sp.]HET7398978.1 hypothetical protein [Intrasporangium sp.]
MSDVQAFLDQCDDVLADWEGSADSATWTADGGHEEERRLARHATLRAVQRVVCDTCRTDIGCCLTFRTGGQVILWSPRVVDTGHHCGEETGRG